MSSANMDAEDRSIVLFLHGFPQTTAMWTPIIDRFSTDLACLAPSLPGYEPSAIQPDLENFTATAIAEQICEDIEQRTGGRPITLVGHDVGAFVAYELTIRRPELVRALIVINGVHPIIFEHALQTNIEQANAIREYINFLRSEIAEPTLSANGYQLLLETYQRVTDGAEVPGEDPPPVVFAGHQPRASSVGSTRLASAQALRSAPR